MKKYLKVKCVLKSDDYGKTWILDEVKYLAEKNHIRESYEFPETNDLLDALRMAEFILETPPPQETHIKIQTVGEIET